MKKVIILFSCVIGIICCGCGKKEAVPEVIQPTATAAPTPKEIIETVTIPDETVWNGMKKLEQYAYDYEKSVQYKANLQVMKFVWTGHKKYQGEYWDKYGGKADTTFIKLVTTKDKELLKLRQTKYIHDCEGKKVDFPHLCASINAMLSYGRLLKEARDVATWEADVIHVVYQINQSGCADKDMEKQAKKLFGLADYRADLDAYNIFMEMSDNSESLVDAITNYYGQIKYEQREKLFLSYCFPDCQTKDELVNEMMKRLYEKTGLLTNQIYKETKIFKDKSKKSIEAVAKFFAGKLM